jgi:hypothetical protein
LLPHHLKDCEHNPKRPVACTQGCGQTVAKDEMKVGRLFWSVVVFVFVFVSIVVAKEGYFTEYIRAISQPSTISSSTSISPTYVVVADLVCVTICIFCYC